jgi:LAO/AO transport system kinase
MRAAGGGGVKPMATRPPDATRADPEVEALRARFEAGDAGALARAISWVESGRPGVEALLHALHPRVGRAHRVGVTGPPGSGKSTLVFQLARRWRERGARVGIVAVDPTSPFTGGALLGDRIRMTEVATDPGVFIRSMATRGARGGLAATTREVADLLDAFGFDRVVLETVGVGQVELDIAGAADTTVVVLVPESGDAIQAMKAGLMEIADIYDVNKADRPDADRLVKEIEVMLRLRAGEALRGVPAHHGVDLSAIARRKAAPRAAADARAGAAGAEPGKAAGAAGTEPWTPPVLKTVAHRGEGVPELLDTVERHRAWLEASGALATRRRAQLAERVRAAVTRRIERDLWERLGGDRALDEHLDAIARGTTTPYAVAEELLARLGAG